MRMRRGAEISAPCSLRAMDAVDAVQCIDFIFYVEAPSGGQPQMGNSSVFSAAAATNALTTDIMIVITAKSRTWQQQQKQRQ